jgi:hypothetical protein
VYLLGTMQLVWLAALSHDGSRCTLSWPAIYTAQRGPKHIRTCAETGSALRTRCWVKGRHALEKLTQLSCKRRQLYGIELHREQEVCRLPASTWQMFCRMGGTAPAAEDRCSRAAMLTLWLCCCCCSCCLQDVGVGDGSPSVAA